MENSKDDTLGESYTPTAQSTKSPPTLRIFKGDGE
jgi:hypothetical protein